MINKKGFEFSFGWIFAIIVGAVMIFLAIYAASSVVKTEKQITESSAAKELGILLNPVETNLESGKISFIKFPGETRIFNNCDALGTFGAQKIQVAIKSGIGKEWGEPGAPSTFYNKYIFSASIGGDKEFIVFSKPFAMPYKIADLIYLIPSEEKYCFVDPPASIEEELEPLKPKNINLTSDIKKCEKGAQKVCFSSTGCDIDVDVQAQKVRKQKQTLYYSLHNGDNSLLYGSIFAEPGIYECQIKRLMQRASELALLYRAKSEFLSPKGCSSGLEQQLLAYANATRAMNNSAQLKNIGFYAQELGRANDILSCPLF